MGAVDALKARFQDQFATTTSSSSLNKELVGTAQRTRCPLTRIFGCGFAAMSLGCLDTIAKITVCAKLCLFS